ncbi:maleylacetate reductase [Cryobacterium sp. HLT2-28]|nr:maleylacetate reductase [Cryobacterium sp. HLT2-28]
MPAPKDLIEGPGAAADPAAPDRPFGFEYRAEPDRADSGRAVSGQAYSDRAASGQAHSDRAVSGPAHSDRAVSGPAHSDRADSGPADSDRAASGPADSGRADRQRVLFGTGRAGELLPTVLAELGVRQAMLIGTRRELERSARVLGGIRPALVFDEVVQHVPVELAERATQAALDAGVDALVAIGGGSAIGLAKAVALRAGQRDSAARPLLIVAVPTTYSGSEATAIWGLVDGGLKTTGIDPRVLPAVVIYDAELTRSLPRGLSVSSGLNALAHAVDALWAPDATAATAAVAVDAIRMLAVALPAVDADPGSLTGREDALLGAHLAAGAFSATGSGLHHKISHVLGGTFGLPHSETHAVVLPHVVAFNVPAAPAAEAQIATALGAPSAVAGLVALRDRLHAPTALRELGFREGDIPRAVTLILAAVPTSNPRTVTADGLSALLRAAWSGAAPGSAT